MRDRPRKLHQRDENLTESSYPYPAARPAEDARKQYSAAPIVEAGVELYFTKMVSTRSLKKVASKISKKFPNKVEQKKTGVSIDFAANEAKFEQIEEVVRLSSSDETRIAMLRNQAFAVIQLAPYLGFDNFISDFDEVADHVLKIEKSVRFARAGLRYQNRIDIPFDNSVARYEDYLDIYIHLPANLPFVRLYDVRCEFDVHDFKVVISSGRVEAMIPNFCSIILDIDIIYESQNPMNLIEARTKISAMRDQKNAIFESLVTDKARALFDA